MASSDANSCLLITQNMMLTKKEEGENGNGNGNGTA